MLFFGLFPVAGCELQFAPVAVPHTDTPSKHLHLHFICLLLRGGKFGARGATTPLSAVVVVLGQHWKFPIKFSQRETRNFAPTQFTLQFSRSLRGRGIHIDFAISIDIDNRRSKSFPSSKQQNTSKNGALHKFPFGFSPPRSQKIKINSKKAAKCFVAYETKLGEGYTTNYKVINQWSVNDGLSHWTLEPAWGFFPLTKKIK